MEENQAGISVRVTDEFRVGLKQLLAEARVMQSQVATESQVSSSWVSQMLSGARRKIDRESLVRLAEVIPRLLPEHLQDRFDQMWFTQTVFSSRMEGWTRAKSSRLAHEFFVEMDSSGLSGEQMVEVALFLAGIVGAIETSSAK